MLAVVVTAMSTPSSSRRCEYSVPAASDQRSHQSGGQQPVQQVDDLLVPVAQLLTEDVVARVKASVPRGWWKTNDRPPFPLSNGEERSGRGSNSAGLLRLKQGIVGLQNARTRIMPRSARTHG